MLLNQWIAGITILLTEWDQHSNFLHPEFHDERNDEEIFINFRKFQSTEY